MAEEAVDSRALSFLLGRSLECEEKGGGGAEGEGEEEEGGGEGAKKAKVTKAMDEENEAYEKLVVPQVLELIVVLVIPGN